MKSYVLLILSPILVTFAAHAEFKTEDRFIFKTEVNSADNTNADWWKTAVIYQIYIRSFMDSNGDGIGDIQGIIQKLPHLKDAGVTAVLLSPIMKSSQLDLGYDITDYQDVDADYGTFEDVLELLTTAARDLGIKIILDLVLNQSSNQHKWFIKSEAKQLGYEDYYVWHDGKTVDGKRQPPNNWLSEYGGSAWEFSKKRQQYYYHAFAVEEPDLNYANPDVVDAMKRVISFWLGLGADGLRINAASYLFEDPDFTDAPLIDGCADASNKDCLNNTYTKDLQATYDLIYDFRAQIDNFTETIDADRTRVLLVDAFSSIGNVILYYGNNERSGAHFPLNYLFVSMSQDFNAEDVIAIVGTWMMSAPMMSTYNWVLGTQDSHRVATKFGTDYVDGLNMLTSILPGVMLTYNGEEIGMENGEVTCEQSHDYVAEKNCDTFNETSRDFERTPYQWDNSTYAGFTNVTPWLPVSTQAAYVNLEAQDIAGLPSHYNIYKQLMKLRKNFQKQYQSDTVSVVKKNSGRVVQVSRIIDEDEFILLFNIKDKTESIDFDHENKNYKVLITLDETTHAIGEVITNNLIELEPFQAVILQNIKQDVPGGSGGLMTVHQVASCFVLIFVIVIRLF